LYRSGGNGVYGQNLTNRIFPQGKNVFLRKSQIIDMFLPAETPFAVLLYGIGSGYKATPA
jgi:hypothetical protein